MRIAHVITSYHPIVGGAEKQLAQLARRMTARGEEVEIVTRHHAGLARREVVDGVPVVRIAAPGPKSVAAAAFLAGAVAYLRARRPDVIHCHSFFSPALAGGLGRGPRTVLLAKSMQGGEATSIARKPFGAARIRRIARDMDAFPAVSQEIIDELLGLGIAKSKIRFIPNGVDTDRFAPPSAEERCAVRTRLGLPPSGVLVVFAGRLSAQKRLDTLAEAWSGLVAAGCAVDAQLLIAEAERIGPPSAEYLAISGMLDATPQLQRLGHVSDMPALLRAADVFVLPSGSEGLSNALLEACASGLACVATDIGGTRDVIAPGESGLLIAPGDAPALRDALGTLIADPERRVRLGLAARAAVEARYGIGKTVDDLLALYEELAAPRAHPAGRVA